MELELKPLEEPYLAQAVEIWNEVVEQGAAFPQLEMLNLETGRAFFAGQSHTGIALAPGGEVVGLYILHPNNVGRCGHICNTSYAVKGDARGQKIGRALVEDSIRQGRALGFRILQFNAVVASNQRALALYKALGFTRLGVIPGGFCNRDGVYEDIIPHYIVL